MTRLPEAESVAESSCRRRVAARRKQPSRTRPRPRREESRTESAGSRAKRKAAKKADAYDGWTKPQLQEELVKRGLPKSGNVPELRERLLAND